MMSRSVHILYAHIVISTAHRYPYLSGDVRAATLADILKHIKGKSAYQLNRSASLPIPFRWSKGYFVASVSPGDVPRIRTYILDQEKTARAEYEAWVDRHFGPPDGTASF